MGYSMVDDAPWDPIAMPNARPKRWMPSTTKANLDTVEIASERNIIVMRDAASNIDAMAKHASGINTRLKAR